MRAGILGIRLTTLGRCQRFNRSRSPSPTLDHEVATLRRKAKAVHGDCGSTCLFIASLVEALPSFVAQGTWKL